ncbi:MAG TPA: NAD-dependent epimerase/dehydratase family protein [Sporichthyaceae bacterium]|nr:NAD-dependent epimerase/dehydratase family protein [Sporichthyaceae bacterium]
MGDSGRRAPSTGPESTGPARWRAARDRSGPRGLRVVVTGSDGPLTNAVVERLGDLPEVDAVRLAQTPEARTARRLRDADVLVHVALTLDSSLSPTAVRDVARILEAGAGVPRFVLVSSAMAYGADPGNELPLDEDTPLRAADDGGLVAGLLDIERQAAAARPEGRTVLRPAMLVGRGADNVFARHFSAPRLLQLQGTRPAWQFCHVDDLIEAIGFAVTGRVVGVVTVGCEGWLEQETVEVIAGMRRLVLPAALAFGTAERLHRVGVSPAPASELRYVSYPWVVPCTRLLAAGWRPAYDNASALAVLLADMGAAGGRRGLREAPLSAAGAAMAMVGTAALLRQARRRRRG